MTEVEPINVTGESPSRSPRPAVELPLVEHPVIQTDAVKGVAREIESEDCAREVDLGPAGISAAAAAPGREAEGEGPEAGSMPAALWQDTEVRSIPWPDDNPDQAEAGAESESALTEPTPEVVQAAPSAPPSKSLKTLIESELASLNFYHRQVLDSGEVEAIHKMRVVTRRLQAAIDLVQFKPDQLKIKGLKKKLRRWRRSLSKVRNYDVFLTIVERETLARRPGGRRPYELIGTELEKRRISNLRKARSELEHIKIEDVAAKLGLAWEPGGDGAAEQATPCGGDSRASDAAIPPLIEDETRIAARAFERLRQRLAEFQAKALRTHATDKPAEIHELRIAAKRLRYLIEALSQMGYGDASRAVEWLKATQDRLGDLHDIEAFGEEVVRVAARPRFVRKHMADAGEMLQAASRFLAKRESLRARLLPVRVPSVLGTASSRMTRSAAAGSTPRDSD